MRIKILFKRFLSIGVAAILTATLVGCFDLGSYSDEEDYYDTFGDIRLVYQNPDVLLKDVQTEDYSVQDYFYNSNTGQDFVYGDPKDDESDEGKDIPQLPYLYMAIPIEQDLQIESFALYFNAVQSGSLEIFFYVVDELPNAGDFTTIRLLGDPEYQQKLDDDGNAVLDEHGNPIFQLIEYSDPDEQSMVGTGFIFLQKGEWDAIVMEKWNSGAAVEVKKSQYLLLRFVNNGGLNTGDKISMPFRITNLLIRAIF